MVDIGKGDGVLRRVAGSIGGFEIPGTIICNGDGGSIFIPLDTIRAVHNGTAVIDPGTQKSGSQRSFRVGVKSYDRRSPVDDRLKNGGPRGFVSGGIHALHLKIPSSFFKRGDIGAARFNKHP